uniref:PX domain-containing protein n=1 Tax=Glossina brevipalpis TaxID=37001 RepID=A0A1A9WNK0_9MUSC
MQNFPDSFESKINSRKILLIVSNQKYNKMLKCSHLRSMAIFERRYHQQHYNDYLDDTLVISCVIETAQEINGHTEYLLRLQRGPLKENCWRLLKRYNDFVALHKHFSKSGIPLSLPGKRLFGNMRPDFIAERRQALQHLLSLLSCYALWFICFSPCFSSYQHNTHLPIELAIHVLCAENKNAKYLNSRQSASQPAKRKHKYKAPKNIPIYKVNLLNT